MPNAAIATRIMSINRLCRLFVVITCSSYPDSVGCSSSSLVPRILSARLEACGVVQRPIALSSSQAQNGNNVMNDKRSRLADTGPECHREKCSPPAQRVEVVARGDAGRHPLRQRRERAGGLKNRLGLKRLRVR